MTSRLLDDVAAGAQHLASAIAAFDKRCRQDGLDTGKALAALLVPPVDPGGQALPKSRKAKPAGQNVSMLMDYQTTALYLGLSQRTLRRLVEKGDLPVVTIGSLRRFHRQDLTTFVETRRQQNERR